MSETQCQEHPWLTLSNDRDLTLQLQYQIKFKLVKHVCFFINSKVLSLFIVNHFRIHKIEKDE